MLIEQARAQEWLVDAAQLRSAGISRQQSSRLAARGTLVRAAPGVYDLLPDPPPERRQDPDVERDDVYAHRRRRAAWLGLLAYGPEAVAVGQTALVLHGVQGLPFGPRVEVTRADRRARTPRGTVAMRRFALERRFDVVDGRLVVPVETALAQAVPELDRRHAVAAMDSALHQRLVTPVGLQLAHDLARGRRGVARTHEWWDLANGGSESPSETWARLSCIDAGIPPDRVQLEFLDRWGSVVARVDLAWWLGDGRWLIAEIDGLAAHSGTVALVHDSRRQNPLVAAGHTLQRFTGTDAWHGVVGTELERLLKAAGWSPRRPVPAGPVPLVLDGYGNSRKAAG